MLGVYQTQLSTTNLAEGVARRVGKAGKVATASLVEDVGLEKRKACGIEG